MLLVGTSSDNLVPVKTPSSFQWGLSDISDSDSGRVQDENDTMYKNRTSQKRKLNLTWNGTTPKETSAILQAFNPEYVFVQYPDALSGKDEIREFYSGDKSAPMHIWTVGNKLYTQVSFNIIER